MLLDEYPILKAVETTVEKPWAPVGLPLDTVSVTVKRSYHTAYIALGSNMGDKEKYIESAIKKLNAALERTLRRFTAFNNCQEIEMKQCPGGEG